MLVICFHQSVLSIYRLPTMGGSADRTLQVAAYPTMGGRHLNRHRKPEVAKPSLRSLTPKASMASEITHVSKERRRLICSRLNVLCTAQLRRKSRVSRVS